MALTIWLLLAVAVEQEQRVLVVVVLVVYALAQVSCWLKAQHTQSQSVAVVLAQQVMALLAHLALIQFFQLLPHLVVVRVVDMVSQAFQAVMV
jgi:hypothetical protein